MQNFYPVTDLPIDIPVEWEQIHLDPTRGVILVIGAPDTGKSTFARYLARRLSQETSHLVAFLDGDAGQTSLGPPTTMTLSLAPIDTPVPAGALPGAGPFFRFFTGSTTPRGHMLAVLAGAGRLVAAAQQAGALTIVVDTSGLVDPAQGGLALKLAKASLLQPVAVIGIQRENELEPFLVPLRRSQRMQVLSLKPSPLAQKRNPATRRLHRARQYAAHFTSARPLELDWTKLAVFPYPRFSINRLVALEDVNGFTLALGIVTGINRQTRNLTVLTPLPSLRDVTAIQVGGMALEPGTFQDERLG